MSVTYWTDKPSKGGYEKAHGNKQLDNGEWINTNQVLVHRLSAVAWFGFDAVVDKDIHHRIPIPWLNIECNLLPLPRTEHGLLEAHIRKSTVARENYHGSVIGEINQ